MNIRKFDEQKDIEGLKACIVELQDYEKALDSRLPSGKEIVDRYYPEMMSRNNSCDGIILVAEFAGKVAGYCQILLKVSSGELEDGDLETAVVQDLVVRAPYRGKGIARLLMDEAESIARSSQAACLRIGVLASNKVAWGLYESIGYKPFSITLEKSFKL